MGVFSVRKRLYKGPLLSQVLSANIEHMPLVVPSLIPISDPVHKSSDHQFYTSVVLSSFTNRSSSQWTLERAFLWKVLSWVYLLSRCPLFYLSCPFLGLPIVLPLFSYDSSHWGSISFSWEQIFTLNFWYLSFLKPHCAPHSEMYSWSFCGFLQPNCCVYLHIHTTFNTQRERESNRHREGDNPGYP